MTRAPVAQELAMPTTFTIAVTNYLRSGTTSNTSPCTTMLAGCSPQVTSAVTRPFSKSTREMLADVSFAVTAHFSSGDMVNASAKLLGATCTDVEARKTRVAAQVS